MSEVNVVYETTSPRYVVECFYRNLGNPGGGMWEADKGFASLDDAKGYADEQQATFLNAKFRVVDNVA